jgi:hypothetical protein
MTTKKYLKIKEIKLRFSSNLIFELVEKKDEKDCYYIKVESK